MRQMGDETKQSTTGTARGVLINNGAREPIVSHCLVHNLKQVYGKKI
jgi:hypothetical protein